MQHMYQLKPRVRSVRPFLGIRTRDEGATACFQAGVTTYGKDKDGNETYQLTGFEISGRSDHLADAIDKAIGNEVTQRLVSEASADDAMLIGTPEQNAKKPAVEPTTEPTEIPAAA